MKAVMLALLAVILSACTIKEELNMPPYTDEHGNIVKDGWSATGNLTTGNRTKQVSMQADFPEAGTYTLEFTIQPNNAAIYPTRCEALIFWSVEGNFVTRRITVQNGTSVTGVGQGVKVVMSDKTGLLASGEGPGNTPVDYPVSVQVAPGSRASTSHPPIWVPPEIDLASTMLAPGASLDIKVPLDAGIKSVLVTGLATHLVGIFPLQHQEPIAEPNPFVTVKHLTAGFNLEWYEMNRYPDFVPLFPGTDEIQVVNFTAGTENAQLSVIFGIDG